MACKYHAVAARRSKIAPPDSIDSNGPGTKNILDNSF
jgi:hypothetical protein